MSVDIDLYEFQSNLKKYEEKDNDWLIDVDDKRIAFIEVGNKKNPKEINDNLVSLGHSEGDRVLVVIQ